MKRSAIILWIFLLIPLISAVELNMKDSFSQGETLSAKLSGNFLDPVLKENIQFYRGHVRISMDAYVAKINGDYYIYSILNDKSPKNYSILLTGMRYMKGSQISEEEIEKNFTITETFADFSADPGFIISNKSFSIKIQNLQDKEITVEVKTATVFGSSEDSWETSLALKSGEIKKINFDTEKIKEPTLANLELSSGNTAYSVPVYIYVSEPEREIERVSYRFEPEQMNLSIPTNSSKTKILYLYNNGEKTLENISLALSSSLKPYASLSIDNISELEANFSIKIEIYFLSNYEEKFIEGQISARAASGLYAYSAIFLNFIRDYIPAEEEYEVTDPAGISSTPLQEESSEGTNWGATVGWGIVIVIIVFLAWFFLKKYRGAKNSVNLLKIARGE